MKITNQGNDSDSLYGGIIGFMASLIQSFFSHFDGWAILQSMFCALSGYLVIRLIKKIFPEKSQTK